MDKWFVFQLNRIDSSLWYVYNKKPPLYEQSSSKQVVKTCAILQDHTDLKKRKALCAQGELGSGGSGPIPLNSRRGRGH